jgi:hypothetical protein
MKKYIIMICCLIWIFSNDVMCLARNSEEPLIMNVTTQPGPYFLGQGFNINVAICNKSGSPIKILRPYRASLGVGMILGKNSANSDSNKVVQIDMNIMPSDIVTLEPGQSISNTVALTEIIDPPSEEGIYLVKVTYRSYGKDAIKTESTANLIQVEYKIPEGDNLKAWLLFKNRKDKSTGLLKIDVLHEIMACYSNTQYAVEADKLLKSHYPKEKQK